MSKNISYLINTLAVLILVVIFVQCSDDSHQDKEKAKDVEAVDVFNHTAKSNILNFDGELFSVPSPIQSASLIKKSGLDYNADLVNNVANIDNYNSALNNR